MMDGPNPPLEPRPLFKTGEGRYLHQIIATPKAWTDYAAARNALSVIVKQLLNLIQAAFF
jgi:hypothetical protein